MGVPPVSDETCLEALACLERHGGNKAAAANELGITRSALRNRLFRAAQRGLDGSVPKPLPPGQKIRGVSTLYRIGEGGADEIMQWVKTTAEPSLADAIEEIKAAFAEYEGRSYPVIEPATVDDDLAVILPVADAHFGMYAWGDEAGEDYDLAIADTTNRTALARLIEASPPSSVAVVLGLGDLVHTDNASNMTNRSGNALDVDTRYAKVLQTAVLFMIHAVELSLARHRRVIVRNLPGNHDENTAVAVSTALWAWFRNNDRVDVDTNPGRFWWWRHGASLLGATHGDMAKMPQLPLIMAASCPEDWGATKFRYIYTGHVHHKSAIEQGGVIVESFQSPATRDAWHTASGFRSGRSLSAVTLHREHGEIARFKVNIV